MGDAERLVQVEVADIGAKLAGPGQADEGIEVGAVEVHLTARVVHSGADLADRLLEHAVGRGVGDHEGSQLGGVLVALGLQVDRVDVALVVTGDDDDVHTGHHRRGGVGAVRR